MSITPLRGDAPVLASTVKNVELPSVLPALVMWIQLSPAGTETKISGGQALSGV
jgi:hypothetical protein